MMLHLVSLIPSIYLLILKIRKKICKHKTFDDSGLEIRKFLIDAFHITLTTNVWVIQLTSFSYILHIVGTKRRRKILFWKSEGWKNLVQWSVVMHCGDVFGIHPEGVVVKVKEGLAKPQWGEIFFERACLFL